MTEQLSTLTLRPNEWPADPALTRDARQADAAVHLMAGRARTATSPAMLANVYVDLISTCANCHSAHPRVWGPRAR